MDDLESERLSPNKPESRAYRRRAELADFGRDSQDSDF